VPPELVRVGYVSGAHGLRGALRLRLDNRDSDILHHVQRLTLAHCGAQIQYQVLRAQPAGRGTLKVALNGINAVDAAEELRGAIVMVAAADLPAPVSGEFYYFQAVGCEVVTTAGVCVGIIEEVFSNGANDVWVVRGRSAERLVPVIEDVVKGTDWIARRVTIEAIPGLLD
jgi:16S rRNA processing protein RimM